MHTRAQLADDLRGLGLVAGDVVMVHASVRAVGPVAGGPDQIHLAIKDAITNRGTLMMYVGCPRSVDEVGRGSLTPGEEKEILDKLPPFDHRTARAARDHGILAEFLRTYPGSHTNSHVVRFAVWGRLWKKMVARQPWDFAFGRGSLLERLVEADGKVLLLGSDLDAVTLLDYAEHIVEIPDKRIARFKVPIAYRGRTVWKDMCEYDMEHRAHDSWPDRFFAQIVEMYLTNTGNIGGRVGDAKAHLFSARGLIKCALPVMRRTAMQANRTRQSNIVTPRAKSPD